MDAVAAKICSVCGIDCSAMKRAKDANGRYICSECLERAREAKVAKEGKPVVVATGPVVPKKVSAAPAMLPNGVDPILDNLVAGSKALHQVACTQCSYPMDREAKICTHCGFNTLSGKVTRTAVFKAPKEIKSKQPGDIRSQSLLIGFGSAILLGGLIFGGTEMNQPLLAAVGMMAMLVAALAVYVVHLVFSFRQSVKDGVVSLVLGLFATLGFIILAWRDKDVHPRLSAAMTGIGVVLAAAVIADQAFGYFDVIFES